MQDSCSGNRCSTVKAAPETRACRECGQTGSPVAGITLESLLVPKATGRLLPGGYLFDSNPNCAVVYFSNETGSYFEKSDLQVRVGIKERFDPILVCYCFGHTRESIESEILKTGQSSVFDAVTRKVQADECACEIRNPSGRCCLGEISRTVKRIEHELDDQATSTRRGV